MPDPEPVSTPRSVRVVEAGGQRALVALRAFDAGEVILVAAGVRTGTRTQSSFQLDARTHFDVPADADEARIEREHAWRYLNHSCDPNAYWRDTTLLAVRAVAAGDELTFDYETTEDELAVPFPCHCGSPDCEGREIRGYQHLTPDERARRRPHRRADLS